jgi:hypothetical protein
VVRDEASVPTQPRVGLHHEQRPAVTAERTRERGKDGGVVGFETRTRDLALQHRELVAQHEDLEIFGAIASTAQHEEVEYEADKTVDTRHTPILAASEPRRSCRTETAGHHAGRFFRHAQDSGRRRL